MSTETSNDDSLGKEATEFSNLSKQFDAIVKSSETGVQALYKEYQDLRANFEKCESKILKALQTEEERVEQFNFTLKKFPKVSLNSTEKEQYEEIEQKTTRISERLSHIRDVMPRENGLYLRLVLGNLNLNVPRLEKLRYKDEYEVFKVYVSICILIVSLLTYWKGGRALDAVLHFLLVWYYCTLTIRESILIVNGSKIRGWWRFYHFCSTVQSGLIILWPDNKVYADFRTQYLCYTVFVMFIQFIQYKYQSGVLYRLRALGERTDMDITVDGFRSWMWKGLSFLLPFLYGAYIFQAYNVYTLYKLSLQPEATWHTIASGMVFFVIFVGNVLTLCLVIIHKVFHTLDLSEVYKKFQ